MPHLRNRVVALKAESGKELWRYDAPVWDHFGAAGDEEGFAERSKAALLGEKLPCACRTCRASP